MELRNLSGSYYLVLTYLRPDPAPPDLIYKVEVSSDGTTWTSGGAATVAVSTTTASGLATVIVRDATPANVATLGRRIRLSIEKVISP